MQTPFLPTRSNDEDGSVRIRALNSSEELQSVPIKWAANEGWNPGTHDAECFFAADPQGFIVAESTTDQQPPEALATISAVHYHKQLGFIGFYIVKPGHRGKGLGARVWNAAITHLLADAPHTVIGLDAVVEQQPTYRKSGFQFAWRNVRFCLEIDSSNITQFVPSSATTANADCKLEKLNEEKIASMPQFFDALDKYDAGAFGLSRSEFLRKWITRPGTAGFVAVDPNNNQQIRGFGNVRPCMQTSTFKIGPLFADSTEIAHEIFVALCRHVVAETATADNGGGGGGGISSSSNNNKKVMVYLDVPLPNTAAVEHIVKRYKMMDVFETGRMYFHRPSSNATEEEKEAARKLMSPPLHKIFGITSFELG